MKEKLAALIEVKKIIAILITLTVIYLAVTKVLEPTTYMPIFTTIITFYYTQSITSQTQIRAREIEKDREMTAKNLNL